MKGPEDDAGLAGKVAIVSGGGAAGDGSATVVRRRSCWRAPAQRWWSPTSTRSWRQRTVEMIKAEGGNAVAEACDATNEADCKRLVDAAVDRWGRLDFLDNNVGIGSRGSVVDEKPDEYRRVMQVNVETMFLLSKHAIPAMIKTAKGGVDRQHLVDLRAAAAWPHDLFGVEGGGDRAQPGDGGRSRQGPHPGQLHLPRPDVHADGQSWQRHERRHRAQRAQPRC